jgi:hypothetical protein
VVARVFAGVYAPDRPAPTRAFPSYADDADDAAAAAGYAVMEDAGDTLRDGFGRGAFEHSVVITHGAPDILSVAPDRFSGR